MSLLLEQLTSAVTPKLVGYLAKLTNETPANLEKAIKAGLPTILSAMTVAARSPSAQGHLSRIVNDPVNDGTLLAQLPALYQGTMTAAPAYRLGTQLLQSVFANKLSQATQTIAVLSSIKPASSALLVSTLAPHILAVIGQRLRGGAGIKAGNLAQMLEGEHAAVTATLPTPLANLFNAPSVKSAAASAATTVAGARPGMTAKTGQQVSTAPTPPPTQSSRTTPERKSAALPASAVQSSRGQAKPGDRQAPQQSKIGGLWLVFPVGLLMAAGAMGFWSLIASYANTGRAPARPAIRAAEAPDAPAIKMTEAPTKTVPTAPIPPAPGAAVTTKPTTAAPSKPAKVPVKTADATPPPAPVKAADIKAVTASVPPPQPPLPLGAAGTTSFFGITKPILEAPAQPNPDYIREREAAAAAALAAAATEKAEADKLEAAKAEAAKLEAEKAEAAKLETAKAEAAKLEAEKAEAAKLEAEKAEAAKLEAAKAEAAKLEAAKAEAAKLEAEKAEAAKLEAAKAEAAKLETEKAETAKLEAAKAEAAKLEAPKAEAAPGQGGVTTYFGAPSTTAGVEAANLQPCRDGVATAVKSGQVLFHSASADLKGSSIATLNRIAAAFQSCPQSRLRVEGHTDNSGLAEMNQKLSDARAQAVMTYLASKGIDASRISAVGFGATRPVAPNVGAANKMMNRRIEFIVDAL